MALVTIPEAKQIASGTGKVVHAGDKVLALFNLNGRFYALDNRCMHVGGPLGEGKVEGTSVTCPWHGSRFDITTGEVLGPPARRPVAAYPVRVVGNDVQVELP